MGSGLGLGVRARVGVGVGVRARVRVRARAGVRVVSGAVVVLTRRVDVALARAWLVVSSEWCVLACRPYVPCSGFGKYYYYYYY